MTKKVLTVKFNYSMPTEELKKIMAAVAPKFSEIPGCCWKIWLINEDHKEAGGVYLFESATELEQYLKSTCLRQWQTTRRSAICRPIHSVFWKQQV